MTEPNANPRAASGELQSTVTLGEFVRAWSRYRVWFIAGLVIVALGTLIWTKFGMTTFYRTQASFFVTNRFTPESRAGIAETEIYKGGANEQFQASFLATLAEQYLDSSDFLLEVADRMQMAGTDLYKLLNIKEKDARLRRLILADTLRTNLVQARKIETSGVIILTGELPDPEAAAKFINTCLDVLQERFTNNEFGYFADILKLYREKYQAELKNREAMSAKLRALRFEDYPELKTQRDATEDVLTEQAHNLARMNVRIEMLTMATSPEALAASRSVTIVDHALPPLRKSRPKTMLMTGVAVTLYTFVFMVGLMLIGLIQGASAAREARSRE
ncbi:hypothetical protein LLG95_07375 [bacterium]|nr:hypothetical protein [bacterium]